MADSIKAARKNLAADLQTALGRKWATSGESGSIDDPKKPTAVISHKRVTKAKNAPLGKLEHEFTCALVAPQSTNDDTLDDWLTDLLAALDTLRVLWTAGERGVWESVYPCYRITLTTTSTRKAG